MTFRHKYIEYEFTGSWDLNAYSELFTLQECDSGPKCVNIQFNEKYEGTIDDDYCKGIESGKENIFGCADDNGGFIEENGIYVCSPLPPLTKDIYNQSYREEFDRNGNVINSWFFEDGDWFDDDGNLVTTYTNSEYYDPSFMDGSFSVGIVEVEITGGAFTPGMDQDFDFILVPDIDLVEIPQLDPSSPDFNVIFLDNNVVGEGYYYYETYGEEILTEFEAHYWGTEEMIDAPGLLVYEESYDETTGNSVFTLISGAVVTAK
jgi:hypothetical protein